jgi:hypothetical protein
MSLNTNFTSETITYFLKASKKEENTKKVVEIVREYIKSHPTKHIIVASSSGRTAVELTKGLEKNLSEINLVVVKLSKGCDELLSVEFREENRKFLEEKGIPILTSTLALTCATPYAIMKRYGGVVPTELVADVFRLFSQGTNTCVEISLMAADAGLVPAGEEALVVGGTNGGADTVMILKVAPSTYFFKTRILKILAKPIG